MKRIDYSILQGFPLSSTMLRYQQEQLEQIQQLSNLAGISYILDGCTEAAGVVSDGWVVIKGEVLPFTGGPVNNGIKVIITEQVINRNFFGGGNNAYYRVRTATFGVSGNVNTEWLWADFKRNNPNNGLLARMDKLEKIIAPLLPYDNNGTQEWGSYLYWMKPANLIPDGWVEVDEAEWRGRFPLIADRTNINYNTIGATGGAETHTLTEDEMPAHSHPINNAVRNAGSGGQNYTGGPYNFSIPINATGSAGGSQPHNNMPPFRIVVFIKFVG